MPALGAGRFSLHFIYEITPRSLPRGHNRQVTARILNKPDASVDAPSLEDDIRRRGFFLRAEISPRRFLRHL